MTQVALTYDQQPLVEAIAIQRLCGASGTAWIATRIAELALPGPARVRRLRRIAAEYQRLSLSGTAVRTASIAVAALFAFGGAVPALPLMDVLAVVHLARSPDGIPDAAYVCALCALDYTEYD